MQSSSDENTIWLLVQMVSEKKWLNYFLRNNFMLKKFKMLIELVAQNETEHGAIGVTESVKMMRAI